MKALAEFVMRGRFQALLVSVAGAGSLLFCWISAAAIALVTLRKGAGEGGWLLLWALLPSGVLVYLYGDSGPLTLLVGTTALALVLRGTVSLALALLASIAVGAVAGMGMLAFGDAYLQQVVSAFSELLASVEAQVAEGGETITLPRPTAVQVAGMIGAGTAVTSVMCLLLARYWQAALYNPGGFGEEFRALRYPVGMAAVLALAAVALSSLGLEYRSWAALAVLPLSFAGLALVHARVAYRQQGTPWLVGFYLAWVLLDPVKMLIVLLAIADSWFDLRGRWSGRGGPPQDGTPE